jgi:hypothetical protein
MSINKQLLVLGVSSCFISFHAYAVDTSVAPTPGTGDIIQTFAEHDLIKNKLSIVVEHRGFNHEVQHG